MRVKAESSTNAKTTNEATVFPYATENTKVLRVFLLLGALHVFVLAMFAGILSASQTINHLAGGAS